MYATPWFLTYFTQYIIFHHSFSKLDLKLVIHFWHLYMDQDDVTMIFFFSIALLIHHKQVINYLSDKLIGFNGM